MPLHAIKQHTEAARKQRLRPKPAPFLAFARPSIGDVKLRLTGGSLTPVTVMDYVFFQVRFFHEEEMVYSPLPGQVDS